MLTLFFDIDGTLIRTYGAGKAAMERALREEFRIAVVRDKVPYGGRTDPAICHDLLAAHDVEPTGENIIRLQQAYLKHLPACLQERGGEVLPGVVELLQTLQRSQRRMGLLTGNVRSGAMHKLTYFGLWDYFPFGGFGDIHHCRNEVARSALTSLSEHDATHQPGEVWVIGDTPHDVTCARAIGAKAIAVATGWNSMEELHATGADMVLQNLSDFGQLPPQWFD